MRKSLSWAVSPLFHSRQVQPLYPLLEWQLDRIPQVRKIASENTNEDAEVTPATTTHVEPHGTVCSILYVICPEAYIGLT
jgi:hypothetical protein